jgi:hypothetical protein
VADERAQGYRRLRAYCGEVAKAHDEGYSKDLGGVVVGALFFGAAARLCYICVRHGTTRFGRSDSRRRGSSRRNRWAAARAEW